VGIGIPALVIAALLMLAAFLLGLHVASTLGLLSVTLFAWFSGTPIPASCWWRSRCSS
jgi:hypothetical protein